MRKYELTYLISDEVLESDLNKITGKVGGYITDLGGKIAKEEIWGRRKLAYPIQKQDFATYVTLYFSLPGIAVKEFDREMRLVDKILRHLLIVKEIESEKFTLTAEEIAAAAKAEEVITGGEEKSEEVKEEKVAEVKVDNTPTEKTEAPAAEVETEKEKTAKKPAKAKALEKDEEAVVEKPKKTTKKKESDEAERLNKLNEELDDILKDEL